MIGILRVWTLLILAVASSAIAFSDQKANTKSVPDFKVTGIRAHLYYESTGTMSRDILAAPTLKLWNTAIGEGDAEAPSETTMVVVEISCPREKVSVSSKRKLNVKITQRNRTLQNVSLEFPMTGPNGRLFMPVLVHGNNGFPMRVTATISGQKSASKLSKVIDFRSGE